LLSKKVILVEGDAEYILLEKMYQTVTNERIEESNIHIIAVGGKCFKRYLEQTKVLQIKTAVITDNDGNIERNITQSYSDYQNIPNVRVLCGADMARSTFEICFYE
jgi:predicted ATP-dependent endonuclease of OLD family